MLNVTTLRERAWLARYVAEPDRMLAGAVRGVRLLDS